MDHPMVQAARQAYEQMVVCQGSSPYTFPNRWEDQNDELRQHWCTTATTILAPVIEACEQRVAELLAHNNAAVEERRAETRRADLLKSTLDLVIPQMYDAGVEGGRQLLQLENARAELHGALQALVLAVFEGSAVWQRDLRSHLAYERARLLVTPFPEAPAPAR